MTNEPHHEEQPTLWERTSPDQPRPRQARARAARKPTDEAALIVGDLWDIDEVAGYLGVPKQTIYCWRTTGYGPQGFRVGKHLRWRAATVLAWVTDLERRA